MEALDVCSVDNSAEWSQCGRIKALLTAESPTTFGLLGRVVPPEVWLLLRQTHLLQMRMLHTHPTIQPMLTGEGKLSRHMRKGLRLRYLRPASAPSPAAKTRMDLPIRYFVVELMLLDSRILSGGVIENHPTQGGICRQE